MWVAMARTDGTVLAERKTSAGDYARFLHAWIRKPRQNGSIVPSSPYLGRLAASQIDPSGGRVMEFGGGTGALTREILATSLPVDPLEVVEIDADLARGLRRSMPALRILETPAQACCRSWVLGGIGGCQCIISGLPLLAFSKQYSSKISWSGGLPVAAARRLASSSSLVRTCSAARPQRCQRARPRGQEGRQHRAQCPAGNGLLRLPRRQERQLG